MYYTYILLCSNRKYYVGHSKDVSKRIKRHLNGSGAAFTKQNKPIMILWSPYFSKEDEAIKREKQIKRWSRLKKEKLINSEWE